jgi:thioredoxin-related protein
MPNMPDEIKDKHSKPIKEGDLVSTPFRGGKREGEVNEVVVTEEQAREAGVKNPPKVLFTDQHGHDVAHNPETLQHK